RLMNAEELATAGECSGVACRLARTPLTQSIQAARNIGRARRPTKIERVFCVTPVLAAGPRNAASDGVTAAASRYLRLNRIGRARARCSLRVRPPSSPEVAL